MGRAPLQFAWRHQLFLFLCLLFHTWLTVASFVSLRKVAFSVKSVLTILFNYTFLSFTGTPSSSRPILFFFFSWTYHFLTYYLFTHYVYYRLSVSMKSIFHKIGTFVLLKNTFDWYILNAFSSAWYIGRIKKRKKLSE